jgi:hypothetical protein
VGRKSWLSPLAAPCSPGLDAMADVLAKYLCCCFPAPRRPQDVRAPRPPLPTSHRTDTAVARAQDPERAPLLNPDILPECVV